MTTIKLFAFTSTPYWPEVKKASNINVIDDPAILRVYQNYFSDPNNFKFFRYRLIDDLIRLIQTASNELPEYANKNHFKAQFFRGVLSSNDVVEWLDQIIQFRKHFTYQFSPFVLKNTVDAFTSMTNEEWYNYAIHDFLNKHSNHSFEELIDTIQFMIKRKIAGYEEKTSFEDGELKMMMMEKQHLEYINKNLHKMLNYTTEQYKRIFQTSSGHFDINLDDLQMAIPYTFERLDNKIAELEARELIEFLNYQYKATPYPSIFMLLLDYSLRRRPERIGQEKIDIGFQWMMEQTPVNNLYRRKANELFLQKKLGTDDQVNEWVTNLRLFVKGRPLNELSPFLEYGLNMIKQGYDIHLIDCTNKHSCIINNTFERMLDECQYLIGVVEEQKQEKAKADQTNKPTKKIQWLGSQKQLAELFIELKRKGWIADFEYDAIKEAFTKSKTINQILKPGQDRNTKVSEYEQVFTDGYSPQFYNILDNPKKISS